MPGRTSEGIYPESSSCRWRTWSPEQDVSKPTTHGVLCRALGLLTLCSTCNLHVASRSILARGHLLGEAFPNCPISARHHPPPPTLHLPPLCDLLHSTQHCLKLSYLFICLFYEPRQGKDCLHAHCSIPVPPRSLACSKHLEYVE